MQYTSQEEERHANTAENKMNHYCILPAKTICKSISCVFNQKSVTLHGICNMPYYGHIARHNQKHIHL